MAKDIKDRAERIAQCKAVVADCTRSLQESRIQREEVGPPGPSPSKPPGEVKIEKELDQARAEGIRLVFGDRNEHTRDHCIVQGLAIEVAEEAAATVGNWQSPLGGVFGIEAPPAAAKAAGA